MTNINEFPFVSVIIPCRNEEEFIGKCLDSIIENDYSKDSLEVLVMDGMSEDGTRETLKRYAERYTFIKLLDNPKKNIPCAMNIGIKHARGEIIMKMDAHSTYPKNYISNCVEYLFEYQADNAGGVWNIVPRKDTTIAKAIAHVLTHPFASGTAYVKTGLSLKFKSPRWTDTAAFGCFRREIFEKIGLFNEELAGGHDTDFYRRLRKVGGKILLVPDIVINYYADGDLKSFWRHNFADGVWVTYGLKFKGRPFSLRHLMPLAFVLSIISFVGLSVFLEFFRWQLAGIAGVYVMANLGASFHLTVQKRCLSYLWAAPIVFASRHIAYGLGALLGLILVFVPGKPWKGRRGWKV